MTTQRETENAGGRRWEAPRIAYEITAVAARAIASGGGGGPAVIPADAEKIWDDLTTLQQHDVAGALRAQFRAAGHAAARRRPHVWGVAARAARQLGADLLCADARETIEAMVSPAPALWRLPECPGCARTCVAFLCGFQTGAFASLGFSIEQVAAELGELAEGAPASVMFIVGNGM